MIKIQTNAHLTRGTRCRKCGHEWLTKVAKLSHDALYHRVTR